MSQILHKDSAEACQCFAVSRHGASAHQQRCFWLKRFAQQRQFAWQARVVFGIHKAQGDGSRPAAELEFKDTPYGSVEKISMRLHGMHWKGRELYVQTMSR